MDCEKREKARENFKRLHLHLRKPGEFKFEDGDCVGGFWENGVLILPIVINTKFVNYSNMREMLVSRGHIVITAEFAKKLYSKDFIYCEPLLWHELGHIKFGDLNRFPTQEELRNDRINAIKSGTVCEAERKADAFAARHVGIARTIKALEKQRQERYEIDAANNNTHKLKAVLAQKEYEYRIKALERLKNRCSEVVFA